MAFGVKLVALKTTKSKLVLKSPNETRYIYHLVFDYAECGCWTDRSAWFWSTHDLSHFYRLDVGQIPNLLLLHKQS